MSEAQKPTLSLAEEDLQSRSETQDSVGAAAGASSSQSPESGISTFSSMVSTPCTQSVQGSSNENDGNPINSQALEGVAQCPYCEIDREINELVQFLLFKYRMKEQTTKEEILIRVIRNYQEHYPLIFYTTSECMLMMFGIEVKEVEPSGHSYVLVPALGLTYDGLLSEVQGIPKTGLLIKVLCIIFNQRGCACEHVIWKVLNYMGVFSESYHLAIGNAWKLITEDFVQEGYLQCHQVTHVNPAHFEFQWGPKALAEINPTVFFMFLSGCSRTQTSFYPCRAVRP